MAVPEPALRNSARRAYERGRARRAVSVAWPSLAIVAGAWPLTTDTSWYVAAAAALIGASFWLVGRGGSAGRAVGPALAAGVIPLVVPFVTMRALCAYGSCSVSCLAACLVSGAAAGAWLGARSTKARSPFAFVAAGALVAGLAGSLGCASVGVAGIIGMVTAFGAVALPLAAMRTSRA